MVSDEKYFGNTLNLFQLLTPNELESQIIELTYYFYILRDYHFKSAIAKQLLLNKYPCTSFNFITNNNKKFIIV